MDHIKLPFKSCQPELRLPYLAQNDPSWAYDNRGFLEYPERKNFDTQKFLNGQYESSDFEFALAIVQSWCFHGLIIDFFSVFDITLTLEELLHTDASGRVFVTSARLPSLLRELEKLEGERADDERTIGQFEMIDSMLTSASSFVADINVDFLHGQYSDHPSAQADRSQGLPSVLDTVHLSVMILGTYLDTAASLINSYGNFWGRSPYLKTRLLQAGWCRSETYTFINQLLSSPDCLYYISGINRCTDDRAYIHRNCEDSLRCNREKLDRTRYKTKHALSCAYPDTCPHVSFTQPESSNIDSIIRRGQIPVVLANPGAGGEKPTFSVTGTYSPLDQSSDPSSHGLPHIPYVCISHVWSDGMGNLQKNEIPQCQMLRLQDFVNNLFVSEERPVHFWLDTICVPLEYPLRRVAINSMRSIYQGACKVLVLDSVIAQASVGVADVAELFMRIRISTWGRRLWTFHEARLAQRLYYQFANKALTFTDLNNMILMRQVEDDEAWRKCCETRDFRFHQGIEPPIDVYKVFMRKLSFTGVEYTAESWIRHLEDRRQHRKPASFRELADLVNSLKYLWTSWLEDETICLSGVLGLDAGPLTAIFEPDSLTTQELRMQAFLNAFAEVPADFLFLRTPRLKQRGAGWMPISFLGTEAVNFVSFYLSGTPTEQGLLVHLPGILLPDVSVKHPLENFHIKFASKTLKITHVSTFGHEWSDYSQKSIAVIFRQEFNVTDSPAPGMLSNKIEGLLVTLENKVHRDGEECLMVTFGHLVSVRVRKWDDFPRFFQDPIVNAERCKDRQLWCVD